MDKAADCIRLVLADVDGTLVGPEKELTPRAIAAVEALKDAGIAFAITSGRPPRGMAMLIEPLSIKDPIAGFNGGAFADAQLRIIERHAVGAEVARQAMQTMEQTGLDAWLYSGDKWYVRKLAAPHVDREEWTVKFKPEVTDDFEPLYGDAVKIVGVSDDHDQVAAGEAAAKKAFGDKATIARSQPYYLDITHPDANKGAVVMWLHQRMNIEAHEIATLGDMPNDVTMFVKSGLAIAMGNASDEVKAQAHFTTDSNKEDGFAKAIEKFILPRAPKAGEAKS
jgi:Cof subfamily protein (haloacid dehalogenase superfamily)